jgi:hypothetical protein
MQTEKHTSKPETAAEQETDVDAVMAERKLMHEVLYESAEFNRLRNAIRSFITDYEKISWGWDGDCGSKELVDALFDSLQANAERTCADDYPYTTMQNELPTNPDHAKIQPIRSNHRLRIL